MEYKNIFTKLRKEQAILINEEYNHKKIKAKDLMIKPTYLHLNDDIDYVLNKLKLENINYCVVIDDNKHFIGEINDEILLKVIAKTALTEPLVKILETGYRRGINYTSVKDYVKKHKSIISEDTSFYNILKLIDKKGLQFIPVINNQKEVTGIITPSSILKFIINK